MTLSSRPMATMLLAGFGWALGWTAIWWLALDTPLKPLLVLVGHYGFGKHGYLLGLIPVLILGLAFVARGKRGLGVNLVVGTMVGMLACVMALIIFLMTEPNLPPVFIW